VNFKISIYDPNQYKTLEYNRLLKPVFSEAILKYTVRNHLEKLRLKYTKTSKEAIVAASVKYGVLTFETALIAYERIANVGSEPEFVKIPMNTAADTVIQKIKYGG
jgi:hypothetical protein